ncbi:O-phosphoserine--tRNA ligase [Methanothrix sp.]|uniref:O-phosphoserine--tRNA ligase n=1 Tax=Methanothrix sp. TaxID=90426 RepID=UPI003C70DC1F
MKFDPNQIKEAAREDFDKTWQQGKEYLGRPSLNERYPRNSYSFGSVHPIFDTIQKLREAYVRLGFNEAMNPVMVDAQDVYRQFGSEALAVLDRCFYLAGLPRPDIGISDERIAQINALLSRELTAEEVEAFRQILHSYKKGQVEGDDLVGEIAKALSAPDALIGTVLERVFPEFRGLKAEATTRTLRSHMTSGWFLSLSDLHYRQKLPIRLFSVDRCFRREQAEDAARLMSYYSASCVIMDEDVSVEDGKAVADGLLSQFGFQKFQFRPDEKRSKYYIPGTQIEVYAYHPGLVGSATKYSSGWVEVATFGIYSPIALSQYDIPYPVMNLGLGVERLAMILHNSQDVRALSYPQFQTGWELSPREMAQMITVDNTPCTPEGQAIAESVIGVCLEQGDAASPCEFLAWEGELFGRRIQVSVVEPEENTKLCGPASLNEIVVHKKNIMGIPRTPRWEEAFNEGVSTGIRFIDSFAALAAYEVEERAMAGEESETRARIVRSPADINIKIHPALERYITSYKHKLDLRGPVFTTVRSRLL